jgi:hypothetical protein
MALGGIDFMQFLFVEFHGVLLEAPWPDHGDATCAPFYEKRRPPAPPIRQRLVWHHRRFVHRKNKSPMSTIAQTMH